MKDSSDWGITYNYVLSHQNVDIWWICQLRLDTHYVCMKILLYDYINNKIILETINDLGRIPLDKQIYESLKNDCFKIKKKK